MSATVEENNKLDSEDVEEAIANLDPDDEEANRRRRRLLLRRFWRSALGFWRGGGDRLSWALSAAVLCTIVLNLATAYGMNVWNRAIFDAIEKRDAHTVYFLSVVFLPLVAGNAGLVVAQVFLRMTVQRRWRSWLTTSAIARWLANGRYYQLNLVSGDHQNPEARIAEDLRIATESPVDFVASVISAFL